MFQHRVRIIAATFIFLFLGLLGRLIWLQGMHGPELRKRGQSRIHRQEQISPRRGNILDRDGVILAEDTPTMQLWFTPGQWQEGKGQRQEELVLGEITLARIRALLSTSGDQYRMEESLALGYLARDLPLTAELARETGLPSSEIAEALLLTACRAVTDTSTWALFTPRLLLKEIPHRAYLSILSRKAVEGEGSLLVGIEPRVGFSRRYPLKEIMAHVIGYTATLSATEYEKLRGRWEKTTIDKSRFIGELPGVFTPTETERYLIRLYEVERGGMILRASGTLANPSIGRSGIELQYNNVLRGSHGLRHLRLVRDTETGRRDWEPVDTIASGDNGRTIRLTISARLQQSVHTILEREIRTFHERQVTEGKRKPDDLITAVCILMRPDNGAIEAMVSLPSYQPGEIQKNYKEYMAKESKEPLKNRAISENYPPGSTFKPFVALAALTAGAIQPETQFTCNGHITLGNHDFICMRRYIHGPTNVTEALRKSCNVFFYETGRTLGSRRLYEFSQECGFGALTGIDLPNEKPAHLPIEATRKWPLGETFHFAIGQGLFDVTPVQMAVATAAIANGGTRVRPHLLLLEDSEEAQEFVRPTGHLNISSQALAVVRKGMWEVVNEQGTGRACQLKSIDVAGKTGSADWLKGRETHAWFISYAPADNPQVVMVLLIPEGGGGGGTCAPIAREIYKEYFNIKEIEEAVDTGEAEG